MIIYLKAHRFDDSLGDFVARWAPSLQPHVKVVNYDDARELEDPPAGTYIFGGVTNLYVDERRDAVATRDRLTGRGGEVALLNHPTDTLRRYELLRALHESGRNEFAATRVTERAGRYRFPVFIRHAARHDGPLTRLLDSESELESAIAMLTELEQESDLLIIEFCDTSDANGVFRKYGSFVIGDRIVPRSIMFSDRWDVKSSRLRDPDTVREEREFIDRNPHEEWLREVFSLAGVQYGRADYAFSDGRPQVWEINTHPMIVDWYDNFVATDQANLQAAAGGIAGALAALDRARHAGAA
jgi:hypothetical protein